MAARHRKIASQRKDFHHKQARTLAETTCWWWRIYRSSTRCAGVKPAPDPGQPGVFLSNGARAKSGLGRSISEAGWGQLVSILRAKAEDAGRTWIKVDLRHTSDRCEN